MLALKRGIKRLVQTTGYQIVRSEVISDIPAVELEHFFALLSRLGFAPAHIVDVGANHGLWTRTAIRYFPDAAYTLVEPQDHLKSFVEDLIACGKVRWVNAGCGSKAEVLPFVINKRDDSSTFVRTDRHGQSTGSTVTMVPVKTLDEIVAAIEAPPPEMVKIDAEGFDVKVLQGARGLFGKTEIFLIEACVCANYENSVAAVVNSMAQGRYSLLDITDLNRSPRSGVLWLIELAFVRDGSALLKNVTSYE
jgi:FkbM family methyltransferase